MTEKHDEVQTTRIFHRRGAEKPSKHVYFMVSRFDFPLRLRVSAVKAVPS